MEVIPAIDIRGGKCVRLYQGDYERETVYSDSPTEMASRWAEMGATRLHVVDLDGARNGVPANLRVIEELASQATVPVQLGGGMRSLKDVRAAMSIGVDRVMIGTAAVDSPGLVQSLCEELGSDSIVVSVDARDGRVALKGWVERSQVLASDLVSMMANSGVRRFLYTDIARDGTLTEPNFEAIETLTRHSELNFIAAGGISSVEHLLRLAELGVEGAVIGTALYTGDINLREAIETLNQRRQNLI